MNKAQRIQALIAECPDLDSETLANLAEWQLSAIEATDCNWCYECWEELEFDSVEAAISRALYSTYEQVTDKYATEDNY